jgi:hypothetical protein
MGTVSIDCSGGGKPPLPAHPTISSVIADSTLALRRVTTEQTKLIEMGIGIRKESANRWPVVNQHIRCIPEIHF